MRIGQLAKAAGVSTDALRFYERRGLIRSDRTAAGYRDYPEAAVELVAYIKAAKALGFTLLEIGEAMPELWDAPDRDAAVKALLERKLDAINARIGALSTLRDEIARRLPDICPLRPLAV